MHDFTTNIGTYSVMCELIPAVEDRPGYWKVDVLRDGERQNDASYTITQQDAEAIHAYSGRDPAAELGRIAEADVVLGRNQISRPAEQRAGIAFAAFKRFHRSYSAKQAAMKEFIRLLFPSSEDPGDHQAQDQFNRRRERFANLCATEFSADLLDFDSLEERFKNFD